MDTFAFYSYKGGVGRTLALANLSLYLAQFGATVAVIDFDLEAPGLHYKYGLSNDEVRRNSLGLAGYLAALSRNVSSTPPVSDLVMDISERLGLAAGSDSDDEMDSTSGRVLLIPAGDPTSEQYWANLTSIDWRSLFAISPQAGARALLSMKNELVHAYRPDFLLVDSRTGFSESSGVATTLLPDAVVALMLSTPEHIDGTRTVVRAILESASGVRIVPVVSRYEASTAEGGARSKLRTLARRDEDDAELMLQSVGAQLLVRPHGKPADIPKPFVLHNDPELLRVESLKFGQGQAPDADPGGLLDDYLRLFAHLVPAGSIKRYLSGVRGRVREIVLDRPEDALRTLESMANLVGDEGILLDLFKLYALKDDRGKLIQAADRAYRVHKIILEYPTLTAALRELYSPRRSGALYSDRNLRGVLPLHPEFLSRYHDAVDPQFTDVQFTVGVAGGLLASDRVRIAERMLERLVESNGLSISSFVMSQLAMGPRVQEQAAVTFGLRHFDECSGDIEFLSSLGQAALFARNEEAARKVVDSTIADALPLPLRLRLSVLVGAFGVAAELAAVALMDASVGEDREPWVDGVVELISENQSLLAEIRASYPTVLERIGLGSVGG